MCHGNQPHFVCWTTAAYIPPAIYQEYGVTISILQEENDVHLNRAVGMILFVDKRTLEEDLLAQVKEAIRRNLPFVVVIDEDVNLPLAVCEQSLGSFERLRLCIPTLKNHCDQQKPVSV